MRKSDFTGWREVARFSFLQSVKQKSYIIFLVLFSLAALLGPTAKTLFEKLQDKREDSAPITDLVIYDETGLGFDFDSPFQSEKYAKVRIDVSPDRSYEEFQQTKKADDDRRELAVRITYNGKDAFHVTFVQGAGMDLSEMERQELSGQFLQGFDEAKLKALDVTSDQNDFIHREIDREVAFLGEDGEPLEEGSMEGISMDEYMLTLLLVVFCMMIDNMSGSSIALSVVTEKSSKVMEYLMLHVRPLALILGKIVASLAAVFLQIFAMAFCYFISPVIQNFFFPMEQAGEINETMVVAYVQLLTDFKLERALIALAYILLGVILFGIIAGLAGASASKMEELQDSLMVFQALLIIGAYADIFLCIMQVSGKANEVLNSVLCLIPISGAFLLPSFIFTGKAGAALVLGSFALMILCIVGLFLFAASVYEALIFYNGKRLKMGDILKIAMNRKGINRKDILKKEESGHE